MSKVPKILFILIILILIITPFFWMKPGEMDLGGDNSRLFFYNPVSFIKSVSLFSVDPDKMILQAKRVLKKNGKLIIWTPNLAAWFNRLIILFGMQPFFTEVSTKDKTVGMHYLSAFNPMKNPIGHIRVFTLPALEDILKLHGFKITYITGSLFLSLPKPLLFFDKLFSYFPSLASTIAVVAEKQ